MGSRSSVPVSEIMRLYSVSGNRCAYTGCDQWLCEPGSAGQRGVVTGEMAHIVAASSQGPRGRVPLNDDELNRAENLILLCEHHHRIVDSRPHTYTVEVLREMKRLHEAPFQAAPAPAELLPMVSGLGHGMPDDADPPSLELATQGVQVAVGGRNNRVIVMSAHSGGEALVGSTVQEQALASPSRRRWAKIGTAVVGFAGIVAAVLAVLQYLAT